MNSILAEDLQNFLEQKPIIVDVRPLRAFRDGSLEGAKNIMLHLIKEGNHQLPKNTKVLLICEIGSQSELAGLYLEAQGLTDVSNLKGGLRALKRLQSSNQ